MQSQDDKEVEAMLAAYLDGELAEEENKALARRIESGDARLCLKLEELTRVRSAAKEWCSSVMKEAESFHVDLWPKLEACIRADQAVQAKKHGALRTFGFLKQNRAFRSQAVQTQAGLTQVGRSGGSFGRGFSFGFAGGFTAAGCAAAVAMFMIQRSPEDLGMIGGKTSMPLASIEQDSLTSAGRSGNAAGLLASNNRSGGDLLSGESLSSAGIQSGSGTSENVVRVARDRRGERDHNPLAFVSSGRDGATLNQFSGSQFAGQNNSSVNELAFASSIYRLPSDLFGLQKGIPGGRETFSSPQMNRQLWASSQFAPPETNRERELMSEAFSMQLLNPAGINPLSANDVSSNDISSGAETGVESPVGSLTLGGADSMALASEEGEKFDSKTALHPSRRPEAVASLSLPQEGLSEAAGELRISR